MSEVVEQVAGTEKAPDTRDSRYKDLVPGLETQEVVVAGCGAIGRQVALQLAAMGVGHLTLVDPDTVEEGNLGAQGWSYESLGMSKVKALSKDCWHLNHVPTQGAQMYYGEKVVQPGKPVFACVDQMEGRRQVWELNRGKCPFLVDGRMAAEYAECYTLWDQSKEDLREGEQGVWDWYQETLFTQAEAFVGRCTSKTTLYCSNVIAGLMVAQYAKWLRGAALDRFVSVNLLSNQMSTKWQG